MLQREKSIGSGLSKSQDGVGSLDGVHPVSSVPPPSVGLDESGGLKEHRSPPPPPDAGMYAPQQVTAEQLMFGNESEGAKGGKKKSSKQRFAERQVRLAAFDLHLEGY